MKPYIIILTIVASVCFSCRDIYDPDVDAGQGALVVDGLITDEAKPYIVKLSMTVPYDSTSANPYVKHAKVSILDENGNTYKFSESGNGVYVSNPAELVGQPGRSYTLHIETQDGNVYESSSQILLPNNFDDTTYAEYSSQDKLVEDEYGQVSKVTTQGVDLLVDIKNNSDTLPRFRYQPDVTTEYSYSIAISLMSSYNAYCWYNESPNDLVNLTDEKYQTSSGNIQKHAICFIPTQYRYLTYYTDTTTKKDTLVLASIVNRIIRVIQYRINSETYQFYKDVNSLLSAQGKIFDPVAYQFKGNITCKTNPQKLALGLFEASSVRTKLFYIRPGQKKVYQIQSFNPSSSSGCVGGISSMEPPSSVNPPAFWVY